MEPERDELPDEMSQDENENESGIDSAEEADSADGEWEDWEDDGGLETVCLFCEEPSGSPGASMEHMKSAHNFDLPGTIKKLGLDELQSIRLVNWIRATKPSPDAAGNPSAGTLDDDSYLKPVLEDDPLLYSLEFDDDLPTENGHAGPSGSAATSLSSDAAALAKELAEAHAEMDRMRKAFESYRADVQDVFTRNYLESAPEEIKKDEAAPLPEDEEDYYFKSYSSYSIHEQMIKDRARTEAYRDFIYGNKDIFKDKVVLDVGCGTGILSMFCAKAGAKKVYAVDASSIIDRAKKIVELNGLSGVVVPMKGRIEELQLPEKVDIIVSEWMGYCLLYESMLDSVLYARNKWLKPDGLMAPNIATMFVSTISDDMYLNDRVWWWDHVYGFDMSPMKDSVIAEAQVDIVPADVVSSPAVEMISWDLQTCGQSNLEFIKDLKIPLRSGKRHHALAIWFDTTFAGTKEMKGVEEVVLSTGPDVESTHWKQTMLFFHEPVEVTDADGGMLSMKITLRKANANARELIIDGVFKVEGTPEAHSPTAWEQRWYVR